MISYDPLWHTMDQKAVTTYTLREKYKVPPGTITRLRNNQHVTTHTINGLCMILECKPSDIIDYIEDDNERQEWLNHLNNKVE